MTTLDPEDARPLHDPGECRHLAEDFLPQHPPVTGSVEAATVWALLAVAGELREIRRDLRRKG
ncbi:hypothetical protein ACWD4V_13835 [Streptomyces tsukubensis]